MTTILGGLRTRLIIGSVYTTIQAGLAALGWFDPTVSEGGTRQHLPINMIPRAVEREDEIPANTLAIAPTGISGTPLEMGSLLEENRQVFYADFYAEDDAVGVHLSQDVRDILRGLFPGTRPSITVMDVTQTPSVAAFSCGVENVIWDRAVSSNKPFERFWYVVRFDVVDDYDEVT